MKLIHKPLLYSCLFCLLLGTGCWKSKITLKLPPIIPPGEAAKKASRDIIESSIRVALKKPKGRLTRKDYLKVKQLNIQGRGVADITPLAKLPNLEYLSIGGNKISDLSPLKQLDKLKDLDLSKTQVTDLRAIIQMKHLVYLDLTETLYLPAAKINEIKKALPKCTVLHDTNKSLELREQG